MAIVIPNYELLDRVGVGGFGEVWLARERVTEVLRAVKIIPRDKPERADREIAGVKRYQRCSHQHAGLVQILTVGEIDGAYFYVMELADGLPSSDGEPYRPETLRTVMHRQGRFAPSEALQTIRTIAVAVAGLHEDGLSHNDLKPENVLMVKGVPKVADIGLAAPDEARSTAGTMHYLGSDGRPDDLFALGKVLFELLTGQPASEFPRIPRELVTEANKDFGAALRLANRACHPEQKNRFQSIHEFLDSLSKIASRPDRRWSTLVVAVSIVFAAVTLAVGTVWRSRSIAPMVGLAGDPTTMPFDLNVTAPEGGLYTRLNVTDVKANPDEIVAGGAFHLHLRYAVAAGGSHRVCAGVAIGGVGGETRPQKYLNTIFEGVPGENGQFGERDLTLIAPSEAGYYQLYAVVAHVPNEEELKNCLTRGEAHARPLVVMRVQQRR